MSGFTAVNLDQVPAPDIIEELEFETRLAENKAWVIAQAPELARVLELESEPATKVLQLMAYRELVVRQDKNDAARACMLATATGADLDNLAAFYGVTRLVEVEADETANPPIEEELETDDRLRARTALALEGFSTAGPSGAYIFHALTASAEVKDCAAVLGVPGEVVVTVLSTLGNGTPSAALLSAVDTALNDEDVRPLCDTVTVQAAIIVPVAIEAVLTVYPGPDSAVVLANARAELEAFLLANRLLGHDLTRAGIIGALVQPGVQNVDLITPAADVVIAGNEAAWCDPATDITLSVGGIDV